MATANEPAPLRLVITGREVAARERLIAELNAQPGVTVCEGVGTSADAVIAAYRHQPDAVLLELALPGMPVAETVRHLRRAAPRTLIYLRTARGQQAGISAALDAGARDLLGSEMTAEQIATVLRRARPHR